MVIGQSRYFTLEASSGVDISTYTAQYKLLRNGVVVQTGDVVNLGTKFEFKMQTNSLKKGSYELRIFITDPLDGFVDLFKEDFVLTDQKNKGRKPTLNTKEMRDERGNYITIIQILTFFQQRNYNMNRNCKKQERMI